MSKLVVKGLLKDLVKTVHSYLTRPVPAEYLYGYPAWVKLSNIIDTADQHDPDSVAYIRFKDLFLHIAFEDAASAKIWAFGMKFLLKAMDLNYRGITQQLSTEKKNYTQEITKCFKDVPDWKKPADNFRLLINIYDPDKEAKIWRDLKYTFWSIKTDVYDSYAIYDRHYNSFDEAIAEIKAPVMDEDYVTSSVIDGFIDQIQIDEFHRECNSIYSSSMEKLKQWRFTNEKDVDMVNLDLVRSFWDVRRGILKHYKKLDEKKGLLIFDMIVHSEEAWDSEKDQLRKAFKLLELQKQSLRVDLKLDAQHRGRKRHTRGGKWRKEKAKRKEVLKSKEVEKKTNLVLRLMMFKDNKPEVLPKEFGKLGKNESKTYRDNCTCEAF